jgi:hypothetical protein
MLYGEEGGAPINEKMHCANTRQSCPYILLKVTMRKHSCFISAAYDDELGTLQRVLDGLNVSWEWALTASPRQPIIDTIVNAIKNSDFVIGV